VFISLLKRILVKPYLFVFPFVVYAKQLVFRRRVESSNIRGNVTQSECRNLESILEVSIFIPVAPKDIRCIAPTVNSLRNNLQHPISEIIVCGRYEESLGRECIELGVKFIDERDVQPVERDDINYICEGIDRSGWIYQQLLKINASNRCKSDHILIWDCDTEMLKPTIFEIQGKLIIEYSEELHTPYDVCTNKLIGQSNGLKLGFTCHKILFSKDILRAMIEEIEQRFQSPWYDAIVSCLDSREASSFSEYNVYSHYALTNYSESFKIRHWRNFADVRTNNLLRNVLVRRMFSSVSYHSWSQ
jgi:hypothetical protein